MNWKASLKSALGMLPYSAEVVESMRPQHAELPGGYQVDRLVGKLDEWLATLQTLDGFENPLSPKRVLIVANLRWWLEYTVAVSVLLKAAGHDVELGYFPYRDWFTSVDRFDFRRQKAYLRRVLAPIADQIRMHDLSRSPKGKLPEEIERLVSEQSRLDVQYTLQREEIDLEHQGEDRNLFQLRLQRNRAAASAALELLSVHKFDVVIIPNGSILEFGAIYKVARHLRVTAVTFEFGEQRERMWLARNAEVMRLDTTELWDEIGRLPLSEAQLDDLRALMQARRGGNLWENFSRQWQAGQSKGSAELYQQLSIDPQKPICLLCTNVVGDSLALDRQIFTDGMAHWLAETVRHFARRPTAQLVVRVHPGELLGAGHPSLDIVQAALPDLPGHVVLVPPQSKINTYDLIEIADLGLAYTTTVGMEMAMSGVPVIVSGRTHYRGKGFTFDPNTMEEYLSLIDRLLTDAPGSRLNEDQVTTAWTYAYRFFFNYPFWFPWHLIHFWEDIENRSIEQVLTDSKSKIGRTIDALVGLPIQWMEPVVHQGEQV